MSSIGLDLTALYLALVFGALAPPIALLLSRQHRPFWPRYAAANLGGPILASFAGFMADRAVPDDEIAFLALIFSLVVQAPIALWMLLLGRRS